MYLKMETTKETEPELEHVPFSDTICVSTYEKVSPLLQRKNLHGERSSENSCGSLEVQQMKEDLRKLLLEDLEKNLLESVLFGPLTPTTKVQGLAISTLLTHIFAKICDLEVADFVWNGGDAHIYTNHMDQVREQLQRTPKLKIPDFKSLDDVLNSNVSDFVLENYDPMDNIKAPMAV